MLAEEHHAVIDTESFVWNPERGRRTSCTASDWYAERFHRRNGPRSRSRRLTTSGSVARTPSPATGRQPATIFSLAPLGRKWLKPRTSRNQKASTMRVSIRRDISNDRPRLTVYRPRERSYSLGASAWQTPSGQWIVSINSQPMDVATTERHARQVLQSHFDKLEG